MTVASSVNKVTYQCDGQVRAFDFAFKIFAPSELQVVLENTANGETQTLVGGSAYTVSAVNGDYSGGGTVTLTSAPDSHYTVSLMRVVPLLQQTDYRATEVFSAEAHEAAMDRVVMMVQQLAEAMGRTLRISVTDDALLELPPATARANKYFAFDADGQVTLALSAAGQALQSGSAMAYVGDFSAAWPATRPDGVTALALEDTGRIALDVGTGRMRFAIYKHGFGGSVQADWIVLQSVYGGNLIVGPSPVTTIEYQESDQSDPAGRVRLQVDGDAFTILRKTAAGTPGTWTAALTISRSTGQVTLGAGLAMGGGKITGLAAGTANGDAVRYEQMVTLPVIPTLPAETPTLDNQATRKKYVDDAIAATLGYVVYSDVKPKGTAGGTFTDGDWQQRALNTKTPSDGIGTLNNNRITLPAGTYRCRIGCPGLQVALHKALLFDVTGETVLVFGSTAFNGGGGAYAQTNSWIVGEFSLSTPSELGILHRCSDTKTTDGFGRAANFGLGIGDVVPVDELYTVAEFWKIG